MPNKKKVIKGLERCLICDISVIAPEEAQNAYRECEYTVGLYCGEKKLLLEALALLKEQPDIVRCKDCKKRYKKSCGYFYADGRIMCDDWFCADGERRTDDV